MPVPFLFASASGAVPASELDSDFADLEAKIQTNSTVVGIAAGTANAITAAFTPTVTTLLAGLTFLVRAAAANSSTTPTFQADGTTAKTIVKRGNIALLPGDIFGAGHWLILTYDGTLDKYVLDNPARITGTATNDNASAGEVGEYISSSVASGSSVGLSTGTPAPVTSISLTPGDWDVGGWVGFSISATTTVTRLAAGANSVSSLPTDHMAIIYAPAAALNTPGNGDWQMPFPTVRLSFSGTTSVFLVAAAVFATSTLGAYGLIRARRVR